MPHLEGLVAHKDVSVQSETKLAALEEASVHLGVLAVCTLNCSSRAAAAASAACTLQAWAVVPAAGGTGTAATAPRHAGSVRRSAATCAPLPYASHLNISWCGNRRAAQGQGGHGGIRQAGGRTAAADKGAASGSGHPQPTALTVVQLHQLLHAHIAEVGRGPRGCTREAWGRQQVDRASVEGSAASRHRVTRPTRLLLHRHGGVLPSEPRSSTARCTSLSSQAVCGCSCGNGLGIGCCHTAGADRLHTGAARPANRAAWAPAATGAATSTRAIAARGACRQHSTQEWRAAPQQPGRLAFAALAARLAASAH